VLRPIAGCTRTTTITTMMTELEMGLVSFVSKSIEVVAMMNTTTQPQPTKGFGKSGKLSSHS